MKNLLILTGIITIGFLSSCSSDSKTQGCTDPYALNYQSSADYDNGSCIYGCTDLLADNYNPLSVLEDLNGCQYSADIVYFLDYSASQYMKYRNIESYYFYDSYNEYVGYLANDYWWPNNSEPDCLPLTNGSTLTASLIWFGNYDNYLGSFSWQAYPDDGPNADYSYTEIDIVPGECRKVFLSKKKIKEFQEASK